MFEEAEEASFNERALCERDRDYYDGKQLTDAERKALEGRGQPPVIYNRIRRKVNFLLGMERQQRRDPKGFPRNPQDDGVAQSATDSLRYVCDAQDWDQKRSEAAENLFVEGTGAVMVGLEQDRNGLTPSLVNIPWDRLFSDPHSRRFDFGDARYQGIVTWYDEAEAEEIWPDAKDMITATMQSASYSETYDDRPKYKVWSDSRRHRIRVIEIYYLEKGQWMRAVLTWAGYLEAPEPSPYLDEYQRPENPIKAVSLYIDRDNNRYGDVRDMIDPQDEINKRRSKGLHLISTRQVRVGPNAQMKPEQIRKELARPDGVITSDDVEILQTNDMAAQNLQLLQEAKAEIDLQGANSALQGKNENDMSGRAILAQQQGGMVEVGLHMDRLRSLTISVYEAIWNRIRSVWNEERWIRVTDDPRNVRFVGINQPISAADKLMEQIGGDQEAQARIAQSPEAQARLQQFLQGPMAQTVAEVRNIPSEIDVDIVIDEGMDTPTIQAEQFDTLTKILPGIMNLPPMYAKMLIQASSLRDKDKILEQLEGAEQQDPAQEQMKQIAMAKEVAEIDKTKSEANENNANAERNLALAQKAGFDSGMAIAQ